MDLDASGKKYAIKRIVRTEEYKININQLYKMGILEQSLGIS